ncbi:hypothetical protein F5X68DRAFT_208632 [Plectosphaerella plurivora]|uniref:Ribonuclease H1 N-terminal domain-containing protein n=1 Tax=Plectosphaerella plurivora TaxID=936078 RepID=A0A9P9AB63_9PEZI|nr:hypothetical protein F5X68DRAFT_208632 [Plectosphaerella plurivora]
MKLHGAVHFDAILQSENAYKGPKTAISYYAVANGRNPGVKELYEGPGGALNEVHRFSGSCHQSFPTRRQAEQFIKDWEGQMVSVAVQKYDRELSEGRRPPLIKGGSWLASLPPVDAVKQEELEDAIKGLSIAECGG